jgi:hypothetical protein
MPADMGTIASKRLTVPPLPHERVGNIRHVIERTLTAPRPSPDQAELESGHQPVFQS